MADPQIREAVYAWLDDHGYDKDDVFLIEDVAGGKVCVGVFLLDERGKRYAVKTQGQAEVAKRFDMVTPKRPLPV